MVKRILLVAVLVAFALPARAQTTVTVGPVTTLHMFTWDAIANIPLPQDAAALVYFVGVDGARITAPLAAVTCPATTASYSCQANLSAELVTKLNVMGSHSVTLTAVSLTAGESGASIPFVLKSPPAVPTGFRLTR